MENEVFNEMLKVEAEHWWFVSRRKIIDRLIRNLNLKNGINILDAGCGNGDNLRLLSNFGDVIAIDTEDSALTNARSRKIGKVFKGSLPDNIPNEIRKNNDLIVMLDVLEHIDDDSGSLSSIRNVIKDSGTLIITVPAYQFLLSRHDKLHHHKRRYTANKLKKIIEENGWQVTYMSYFNTFLFPLALLDRLKQIIIPSTQSNILKIPNKYINYFFEKIFSFESKFISKFSFPFGLSIIAVAKKV